LTKNSVKNAFGKKMTQKEFAEKLGAKQANITNYERGTNRPAYEDLIAISNLFKISIDNLLTVNLATQNKMPIETLPSDMRKTRIRLAQLENEVGKLKKELKDTKQRLLSSEEAYNKLKSEFIATKKEYEKEMEKYEDQSFETIMLAPFMRERFAKHLGDELTEIYYAAILYPDSMVSIAKKYKKTDQEIDLAVQRAEEIVFKYKDEIF